MNEERLREEFDDIARLSGEHGSDDRYDTFLVNLIPRRASSVLDIGCGLGRLTKTLAGSHRQVLGIDLSPEMIARAKRLEDNSVQLTFRCGNFLHMQFEQPEFDSVISVSALHHMPLQSAVQRMIDLVRPGGTLVIHDLRSDSNLFDRSKSLLAGFANCLRRLRKTGRLFQDPALRKAYLRHGATETYLTMEQVEALADSFSPAAKAYKHWFWKYTIVWTKNADASRS